MCWHRRHHSYFRGLFNWQSVADSVWELRGNFLHNTLFFLFVYCLFQLAAHCLLESCCRRTLLLATVLNNRQKKEWTTLSDTSVSIWHSLMGKAKTQTTVLLKDTTRSHEPACWLIRYERTEGTVQSCRFKDEKAFLSCPCVDNAVFTDSVVIEKWGRPFLC